jgi:hypothetical protein
LGQRLLLIGAEERHAPSFVIQATNCGQKKTPPKRGEVLEQGYWTWQPEPVTTADLGVPAPKSAEGPGRLDFASLSLLILLKVVPFSCGPAPHVSDDGLTALIHMHMLNAEGLRAAVPHAT